AATEFGHQLKLIADGLDGAHRVAGGFIEIAEPHADAAIDRLVGEGVTDIVAVPYVLFGAGHLKDDGPAVLARARQRHPAVRFRLARDLGLHPAVLDTAEDRARDTIGVPDDSTAVVIVGRGSTDPDACAAHVKLLRLLADGRGLGLVEPSFVGMSEPSIEAALERCRRLGAT